MRWVGIKVKKAATLCTGIAHSRRGRPPHGDLAARTCKAAPGAQGWDAQRHCNQGRGRVRILGGGHACAVRPWTIDEEKGHPM